MDKLTKKQRSELMGKIKGRDTKIEKALYDDLIGLGLEYQAEDLEGKPDYVHRKTKVAVFVDGCFFHVCPIHCNLPKTNTGFWLKKFMANSKRDLLVNAKLMANGWKVVRIWGHTIKKKDNNVVKIIEGIIRARGSIGIVGKLIGGIDYL